MKASRNSEVAQETLNALTKCAQTGIGNLLELAIDSCRARCTVGEISDALEKVWGRYQPTMRVVSGAYTSEYGDTEEIQATLKVVKVRKGLEGI